MSNFKCDKTGIEADDLAELMKKMQEEIVKLRKQNFRYRMYAPECTICGTTEFLCGHNKRD